MTTTEVILDFTQNFWELNPQFKIGKPYSLLYDEDKSKKKKESSDMMWFVAYCYHPSSRFTKQPVDDKHSVIGEDVCGSISYYTQYKPTLDMLIDKFCEDCLSPMQQHMMVWTTVLHNRTRFLRENGTYSFENHDELDKMAANTAKIYETIKKIAEDLSKEDIGGVGKGGAMPSLND